MYCNVSILQISVLMRQKLQHQNGAFVIPIDGPIPVGFEIPGTIRYMKTSPVVTTLQETCAKIEFFLSVSSSLLLLLHCME